MLGSIGSAPSHAVDVYDARSAAVRAPRVRLDAARFVELVIAWAILIFVAPLLLTLAVLVRLQDGGPALYGQVRIGQGGRPFRCLKFRSMVVDADARLADLLSRRPDLLAEWREGQKLREDPRVTALGTFLRRSSLDELPQLLNVIRGEMSLVGPRPVVQAEVERYGRHFRHYAALRPGMTGLWQVSGRNDVSYRRRVVMDVAYARRRSALLDLKILVATVPAVLQRRGSC